ncbi:hypothetical protein FE257_002264 [Aspergillus nanangensis]|uniref:Synaptobrevin n=1 Tax=Aspergillus nanangensis TaxID=2582783 RepID=A0AAD4GQ87_ASPNN|nr:hypothetical protein FE257_002264 [Aspergillus nanangensis]
MTITSYPSSGDSSDLALLNLSRLFARLEHNLLSPAADLKPLRQSEYQRMRVGANIEYARTHLQSLERSLPQIKPLDHRHELQTDLSHKRQTLKRLQNVIDEMQSEAEMRSSSPPQTGGDAYTDDDEWSVDVPEEDLLGTPDEGSISNDEGARPDKAAAEDDEERRQRQRGSLSESHTTTTPTATITETSSPTPTQIQTADVASSTTLRNRSNAPPQPTVTASGSALHHHNQQTPPSPPSPSTSKLQSTEQELSNHRLEQEELTNSLLSLASQLKTSSKAFHSSLESEKSVLQRAVDGLDKTTSNMDAASRHMGTLRRMTEGKGWLGRMMLYAWIFGLWLVAVLLVFLGPKLRF